MAATSTRAEAIGHRMTLGAERFGYLVAAALNGVFLWISHQLLHWEWPGFLTQEFDDLLPVVTFSFVVGIGANVLYAWNDAHPIKPLGEMATAATGFAVALRTWQVFPFDFSAHDTNWAWLVRLIIVVAAIGTAIGFVAESVKLARGSDTKEGS